jgi:hypothetical protein
MVVVVILWLDVVQEWCNTAVPLHAMKANGGVEAWLHPFLSWALDEKLNG